jgi:signal transduction histidine kinase
MRFQKMLEQVLDREEMATPLRSESEYRSAPDSPLCVSRLIAHICHDLRLPLAAILANAEFLTRSGLSDLQKAELYLEIHHTIDRMNEIISSLLEYSKEENTVLSGAGTFIDMIDGVLRRIAMKQE